MNTYKYVQRKLNASDMEKIKRNVTCRIKWWVVGLSLQNSFSF